VVTSTLVFEGQGQVREYVGGYEDWLRQRATIVAADRHVRLGQAAALAKAEGPPPGRTAASGPRRASYREQQELLALPDRIEALES
jgi:ATP-binding cassette subfamily F protein uup